MNWKLVAGDRTGPQGTFSVSSAPLVVTGSKVTNVIFFFNFIVFQYFSVIFFLMIDKDPLLHSE